MDPTRAIDALLALSSAVNESELHEHIYSRPAVASLVGNWNAVVGPGDDCAVLNGPDGKPLLITVDQLVEGVHFTPGTPIDLIARKAAARSVSDIAAMGGVPSWATATGLLPQGYALGKELIDALNSWSTHWECPLIGGDLAFHAQASHPLTLTVTVAGIMTDQHEPVLRSGAKAGDSVYLTGKLGGSFKSGRHLTFEPRLAHGQWASTINSTGKTNASAMIDLSDGLGRDAARIGEASRISLELEASKIPTHDGVPGWAPAISDGEDYELLMTIPRETPIPQGLELIGPVGVCKARNEGETENCIVIDKDGSLHDVSSQGWDHGKARR